VAQIFISYSRDDKEFVDRLARDVEAGGFDMWVDREDIRGGESWVGVIGRAIKECSSLLLVFSPNSSKSRKVAQELCLADEYDKQIIPLMLKHCEASEDLKLLLTGRQWVDFEYDYAGGLKGLLAALGGRQTPPPKGEPPKDSAGGKSTFADDRSNQSPQPPAPGTSNQGTPWQAPHNPPPVWPQRPPQLYEVLPGNWVATVMFPMMPPLNVSLSLAPDGSFMAYLPTGSRAQGMWSVNQGNQIYMQGVESNGMLTAPYVAWLNVTGYNQAQINGAGPRGEAVVWRRAG
jgi:TIR domain